MLPDPPLIEQMLLLQPGHFIPMPYGLAGQLTRLGEAQILLPAMLAACVWLLRAGHAATLAARWAAATAGAAALTTATKVAFIGYGIGYAPLDYAGISGHAMFAAAILPVLMRAAAGGMAPTATRAMVALGVAVAALIAVTRVKIGAHSWIEVLMGFALGSAAAAWALRTARWPDRRPGWWLPIGLSVWLAVTAQVAPPSQTHGMVTRLALAISGRPMPYTRQEMRRSWRQHRAAHQGQAAAPGLTAAATTAAPGAARAPSRIR